MGGDDDGDVYGFLCYHCDYVTTAMIYDGRYGFAFAFMEKREKEHAAYSGMESIALASALHIEQIDRTEGSIDTEDRIQKLLLLLPFTTRPLPLDMTSISYLPLPTFCSLLPLTSRRPPPATSPLPPILDVITVPTSLSILQPRGAHSFLTFWLASSALPSALLCLLWAAEEPYMGSGRGGARESTCVHV
jgi:hypothetical protein